MVYEYLVITFLIAWYRKGSLNRLSETSFKFSPLIIFCLLLQLFVVYAGDYLPIINRTLTYWIILTYFLLLLAANFNLHLEGFKIFFLGLLLNAIVIVINGGRMPVSIKALEAIGMHEDIKVLATGYKKHGLIEEQTLFPFLADVIPMQVPFVFMPIVVSIGDLIMTMGICWFIYQRMTKSKQTS
jgi:hypothetical protein